MNNEVITYEVNLSPNSEYNVVRMKVHQKILVKSNMHEKCENATLQKFCPHCVTPTFLCVTLLQVGMYAYTCLTRFYLRLDLQHTFWNCKKVEKIQDG